MLMFPGIDIEIVVKTALQFQIIANSIRYNFKTLLIYYYLLFSIR